MILNDGCRPALEIGEPLIEFARLRRNSEQKDSAELFMELPKGIKRHTVQVNFLHQRASHSEMALRLKQRSAKSKSGKAPSRAGN